MAPDAEQEKDDVRQQHEAAHEGWAGVVESAQRKSKKPIPKLSVKRPKSGVPSTTDAGVAFKRKGHKKPQTEPAEIQRSESQPPSTGLLSAIINGHDARRIVSAPVPRSEAEGATANFRYAGDAQEQDRHRVTPDRLALANIEKYVVLARRELPELNSLEYASTEDAVFRLIEHYRKLSAPIRDKKGQLSSAEDLKPSLFEAEEERASAQRKLHYLSKEFEDLNTRYKKETDHLHRLVEKLRYDNFDFEQVSAEHAKLQTEQKSLQQQISELKTKYEDQLTQARNNAATQSTYITDLKFQLENHRSRSNAHEERTRKARAALEQHWKAGQQEHIDRPKEAEEAAIARLHVEQAKYEDVIKDLKDRMEINRSEHESRLKRSEEMSGQRLHEEKAKHEESIKSLIVRLKRQFKEELLAQKTELSKEFGEHKRVFDAKYKEKTSSQRSVIERMETSMHDVQTGRVLVIRKLDETERRLKEERLEHRKELANYEDIVRRMRSQHKMEGERQKTEAETRFKQLQQRYEKMAEETTSMSPNIAEPKKDIERERPPSHVELRSAKFQVGSMRGRDSLPVHSAIETMNSEVIRERAKELKDHHRRAFQSNSGRD
jgi:hypothetical protein